jgi:prepilin-type N-terminal cleavage/methylation domain-containing protein
VHRRFHDDEHGLTLIELMVSMVLLSIILAAVASSLITFSRATVDNERRVQATALLNRLHEELQAVPWFDAAIYEAEAAALDPILSVLNGRELVEMPGPSLTGCAVDEPDCNRRDRVPEPYLTPSIDGREYEVWQAVTWADASQQAKRFTTVVRWTYLDETLEEVFESERTATAAEAGDPTIPRVIQFSIGPSPVALDEDGLAPIDLAVIVRFSQGVDSASLRFYSVDGPATAAAGSVQLVERTLSLTPTIFEGGKGVEYQGSVPAGAYIFPDGPRTFRAIGLLAAEPYEGAASVTFRDGPHAPTADPGAPDGVGTGEDGGEDGDVGTGEEPPATPVSIDGLPTFSPALVCMDANHRFITAVSVQVSVTGMTNADYNVSLEYTADGATRTEAMSPVNVGAVTHTGSTFQNVFAAGQDHGFRVTKGNETETSFVVRASRLSDGGSAGPVSSATSLIVREKGKGC